MKCLIQQVRCGHKHCLRLPVRLYRLLVTINIVGLVPIIIVFFTMPEKGFAVLVIVILVGLSAMLLFGARSNVREEGFVLLKESPAIIWFFFLIPVLFLAISSLAFF